MGARSVDAIEAFADRAPGKTGDRLRRQTVAAVNLDGYESRGDAADRGGVHACQVPLVHCRLARRPLRVRAWARRCCAVPP